MKAGHTLLSAVLDDAMTAVRSSIVSRVGSGGDTVMQPDNEHHLPMKEEIRA